MFNVAVLVATFNGEKFIQSQISSIRSQIDVNLHIYVRDDCSNDRTIEILSKFQDASFSIIQAKTNGGSPASNFFNLAASINLEKYDFVAFADQDDIWFPEKLITAIRLLQRNNAELYSSDLIAFDNAKSSVWYLRKSSKQNVFDYLFQGGSAGCTYVLTINAIRLVLEKIGELAYNFPKNLSHDWIIYAICRSYDLKCVHDQDAYIAYRQHSVNAFGAMPGVSGFFHRLKMSRQGWYREQVLANSRFLKKTQEEMKVINAVSRLNLFDKIYLVSQCLKFRRTYRDSVLLGLVIALGFF